MNGTAYGDYELLVELGRGPLGTVWQARHRGSNQIVALKALNIIVGIDPALHASFESLAKVAMTFSHPGLVRLHHAGEHDGRYFYVSELVSGYSVQDWIARKGILPEEKILPAAEWVLDAMAHAWDEHRAVHQHLKPSNILIAADGTIRIADLLMARVCHAMSGQPPDAAAASYLAPEQAAGTAAPDLRTDIYGLGATLYHLITGQRLFQGLSASDVLRMQMTGHATDPRILALNLSDGFVSILEKMLAKDPADRHGDWREVQADVKRLSGGTAPVSIRGAGFRSTIKCEKAPGSQPIAVMDPISVTPPIPEMISEPDLPPEPAVVPAPAAAVSGVFRLLQEPRIATGIGIAAACLAAILLVARLTHRITGVQHEAPVPEPTVLVETPSPEKIPSDWAVGPAYLVQETPLEEVSQLAEDAYEDLMLDLDVPVVAAEPEQAGPSAAAEPGRPKADPRLAAALRNTAVAYVNDGIVAAAGILARSKEDIGSPQSDEHFATMLAWLTNSVASDEAILSAFDKLKGTTVSVEFSDRTREVSIVGVERGRVIASVSFDLLGAVVPMPKSFSVNDLSKRERTLRQDAQDPLRMAFLRGLNAHAAEDKAHALEFFAGTGPGLSDWLQTILDIPDRPAAAAPAQTGPREEIDTSLAQTRKALERNLRDRGLHLLAKRYLPGENNSVRFVQFDHRVLRRFSLYLTGENNDYIFIDQDGLVRGPKGGLTRIKKHARLFVSRDGAGLLIDNRLLPVNLTGWDIFWASDAIVSPDVEVTEYPKLLFHDGFMRKGLLKSNWTTTSGTWELNQHGGGVATTIDEAESATFARSVNAFTVLGSGDGLLTYSGARLPHGHVEACFFFGIPPLKGVIDLSTLPLHTDMLVVLGDPTGDQVAFGWRGQEKSFALLQRHGGSQWQVLKLTDGMRPPLSNWVKIGLDLRNGTAVTAWLDDVAIIKRELDVFVDGGFHIGCGKDMIEFDDVRAWSFPAPEELGAPVHVKSQAFSFKKGYSAQRDPEQFSQWARATNSFLSAQSVRPDGRMRYAIWNRKPLYGDVLYESVPYDPDAGDLPDGLYEFRVMAGQEEGPSKRSANPLFAMSFNRKEDQWRPVRLNNAVWPENHPEFTLRFRRAQADGYRIAVQVQGVYKPISPPITGPIQVEIARVADSQQSRTPLKPSPCPEHHMIYSRNTVHEFFEEAPAGWNWLDGRFRMTSRWACENQWNFMGCASVGVPYLSSKRTFHGDQEHEYFMSLRGVTPWETGDASFPAADSLRLFAKYGGWYNRHDLNFSFCSDGLNPLSGYAIVYGADNNTETRLLRRGKIVARNKTFLFPTGKSHHEVHWLWWNFRIRRFGTRIQIALNGEELFDYVDRDPLPGGHIGFWSVRNGFILSRISSHAEQVRSEPHFLYVKNDDDSSWAPLIRDSLTLTRQEGPRHTRVKLNTGTGFHAIRHTFTPPVDIKSNPILNLPLRLKDDVRLNLHLCISGRSYILQLNGPLAAAKSLLTPEFETGEQCQNPVLEPQAIGADFLLGKCEPTEDVRCNLLEGLKKLETPPKGYKLESITIGNTSNQEYLLAGGGGNLAGAMYEVGTPMLEQQQVRNQ